MKGMTQKELDEVVSFIQKHHQFAYVPEEDRVTEYSFGIKYIDVTYDTRDKTFWHITMRSGAFGVCFRTNHFTVINMPPKRWKYDSLFDLCMAYLKGEFNPKEEFWHKDEKHSENTKVLGDLYLDQSDELNWLVKSRKTGRSRECGAGDFGKLKALEIIYKTQELEI